MELITVSSKVPRADLLDWFAAQNGNHKVFLKLRDHNWSIAGFGNVLESPKAPLPFESWALEDFEDYIQSQNDPDLKLFVAAPFFLKNDMKFILPRFEFVQDGNEYRLLARRWSTESPDEFQKQIHLDFEPIVKNELKISEATHVPDAQIWEKNLRFAQGTLDKIVLARATDYNVRAKNLPYFLLKSLDSETYKSFYQWDGENAWISVSPERLFRIEDSILYTEALAGTRRRGQTAAEDENLMHELSNSKKDQDEHNFVINDIVEKLRDLSLNPDIRTTTIKKLSKVQHLATEIDAELLSHITASDVLRSLHPTAALGGTPTNKALAFLEKNEPFQREYYGGPFGILTNTFSEFFVNIRSAVTNGNRIRIFAGCGIVKDSDPKKEWDELDAKISQYVELLT